MCFHNWIDNGFTGENTSVYVRTNLFSSSSSSSASSSIGNGEFGEGAISH